MRTLILLLIVVGMTTTVRAEDKFVTAAKKFLSTLDAKAKEKCMFGYNDNERYNWNFVPMARKGATFHDLNDQQKNDLLDLLKVFLSEQGYDKATTVS
ncbi:MAG: DUF3500 domain-containing protein [Bacteroidota bacterium]